MNGRELFPAISPESLREADAVYRHAVRSGAVLAPRKHARAVLRCNQLASDNRAACDWTRTIEDIGAEIQQKARRTIFAHLQRDHPYLTNAQRRSIIGNIYFSLRDIGG